MDDEMTSNSASAMNMIKTEAYEEVGGQITELHVPLEDLIVKRPEQISAKHHNLPGIITNPHNVSSVPRVVRAIQARDSPGPGPGASVSHHTLPPSSIQYTVHSTQYTSPPSSIELRDSVFASDSFSDSSEELQEQGDSSQTARCKEYREKTKVKRRKVEQEFREVTERNRRFNKIYNRQKYMITRLKEYYLKSLQNKKYRCSANMKTLEQVEESHPPLVTIKTELMIEPDVVIKTEDL